MPPISLPSSSPLSPPSSPPSLASKKAEKSALPSPSPTSSLPPQSPTTSPPHRPHHHFPPHHHRASSSIIAYIASQVHRALDPNTTYSATYIHHGITSMMLLMCMRVCLGLLLAFLCCAWLYGFAMLQPYFTLDYSYMIRLASMLCISLLVLIGFSAYLLAPCILRVYMGFFTGLLLFYWISLSFRFSVMPMLIPLVCMGIGACYGVLFFFSLYVSNKLYRIASLFALGSITPFSFDWFVPQSWLAYSVFSVSNTAFFMILLALVIMLASRRLSRMRLLLGIVMLLICVDWENLRPRTSLDTLMPSSTSNDISPSSSDSLTPPPLTQLALIQSHIPQEEKWQQERLNDVISAVFHAIDTAQHDKKSFIIFPETIIPIILNDNVPFSRRILRTLRQKSAHITIALGAFSKQGAQVHNSTYLFHQGQIHIFHKVILAPFGERIPLPDMLAKPLYRFFFGIDEALYSASAPQDFSALGRIWRNAICYEGTSAPMYHNAPPYMLMISNNAWFAPSIEPFLQQVLLKYYARRHHTIIAHAANLSHSIIITPYIDDTRTAMPLIIPD